MCIRDRLETLRAELTALEPLAAERTHSEASAAAALSAADSQLTAWHERWESHNRDFGAAAQSAEVEAARIEQLETQSKRLQAQLQDEQDVYKRQAITCSNTGRVMSCWLRLSMTPNATPSRTKRRTSCKAVSYTHLDVYKRQRPRRSRCA